LQSGIFLNIPGFSISEQDTRVYLKKIQQSTCYAYEKHQLPEIFHQSFLGKKRLAVPEFNEPNRCCS
jgi:hypothetical protein